MDSSAEEIKAAAEKHVKRISSSLPIDAGVGHKHGIKEVKKSEMPSAVEGGAYRKLRDARSEARLVGVREKRAKAKADEAESKKK